ncbi:MULTISPECIES: MFS transporter [Wolbachia]|uniref:MFS transporter n=1 Tax=Wolbachia TaxID=953 RepID=UPI00004CA2A3|nr:MULTISPECIES: MFS transporter [Wolbachia]MBS9528928.1 MFS transporter [Wolbachia endosymbiont of Ceratitis capitata]MDX5487568.1 MFS transporter [Wolbachia endosymbiont of Andrena praecox]MDX5497865.1 MFS transporter [Wolbachia endosymbiont of Lasioglossum nitidulum]MDX5510125.1 MFS transporter [Wolbachia endosymbiont of Lasioglossum morio]MDX5543255.1 MFS transporter [Wolbachia endosymbiont of Andrena apicata]MDX5561921.1 MFS transporter [Wolbachia endosymbiont of Andrena bicolor]MDX5596
MQTRVLISAILCRIAIWYDHMLFIDLVNIISREFCCAKDVYNRILQLFGIAGLGAMVRPLGAFIFGHIGDRYGRRMALTIAILLISIPSSLVAFIPSYSKIGITSTILLLAIHVTQGIALGAEQGGSSVYLIEHLPNKKKLGMFFGIISFGRSIGILLSVIVVIICKKNTDFNAWGWRLPFTFSFVLGLISAYSVYTLGETPAYEENRKQRNLSDLPIIELIKRYKRALILAILISVPVNVVVGFTIFLRTIAKEIVSVETYVTTYVNEIVLIITSILMPVSSIALGMLADKVGKERTTILFTVITMVLCCPVLSTAYYYKSYLIIMLGVMALSIIERGINPIGIVAAELFPTNVRFSGVSLSRNISYALHGGFTPMICTWFTITFPQVNFAAGLYVVFCLLVSLVAILQIKPQDKKFDWS